MAQTADKVPTTNPSNSGAGITNPTNVFVADAAVASTTDVVSTSTVSGFGDFALPAGAIIKGIQVDVLGKFTGAGVNHDCTISIQGTGAARSKTWTPASTSLATQTIPASQADLWGGAWTAADFVDGVFKVTWGGSSLSATSMDVDLFTVRIFYTLAGGNFFAFFPIAR